MKYFVLATALFVLASARPDGYSKGIKGCCGGGSSGYSYNLPSTYSAPISTYSAPSSSYSAPSSSYSAPSSSYSVPNSGYSGSIGGDTNHIEKHIYVHVPPPDADESTHHHHHIGQGKKHYKIIFVKAPTYSTKLTPIVSQSEEKTLVYVLVKKPDENIPEAIGDTVKYNKPEVYFIKYRARTDGGGGGSGLSLSGLGGAGLSSGSLIGGATGHGDGGSLSSTYSAPSLVSSIKPSSTYGTPN